MAREQDLDLVEVADKADPPVCRIMDYGKYKYEAAQRAKESRRKTSQVIIKEMKYRPKIGAGDFETKTRKVSHFLGEGHKVKVTIMFRGRELQHPELGRKILDNVAEAVTDVGRVEVMPRVDGRNMTMVLGPDKRAQADKKRKEQQAAQAATAPAAPAASEQPAPARAAPAPSAAAPEPAPEPDAAPAPAPAPAVETTPEPEAEPVPETTES